MIGVIFTGAPIAGRAQQGTTPAVSALAAMTASLTSQQIAQLKALQIQYRPKFQAVVAESRVKATAAQARIDAQNLQADFQAKYRAILTATQRSQFDQAVPMVLPVGASSTPQATRSGGR